MTYLAILAMVAIVFFAIVSAMQEGWPSARDGDDIDPHYSDWM